MVSNTFLQDPLVWYTYRHRNNATKLKEIRNSVNREIQKKEKKFLKPLNIGHQKALRRELQHLQALGNVKLLVGNYLNKLTAKKKKTPSVAFPLFGQRFLKE
jgi:hypothetical protein